MTFLYALKQIRLHWLRTLLALLGVLIGTCAFVVLSNLGLIFKYNMEQELNALGTNIHILNLLYPEQNPTHIQLNHIEKLQNPPTLTILPIATKTYLYKAPNGTNINLSILGIPFKKEKPFNIHVEHGRLLIPSDERNVTISAPLVKEFSDNNIPFHIGVDFLLDHQVLHVVGTHSKQPEGLRTLLFGDVNHQVVMNLDSALKTIPNLNIDRLIVQIDPKVDVKENIETLKTQLTLLSPNITIFVQSFADFYKTTSHVTSQFNLFLIMVASIALLIGGVGIMNIMLVVVMERQTEIGLRMALGATQKQILSLFLFESIITCLLGGIIGIILAFPALYLCTYLSHNTMIFFPKTLVIGLIIPVLIGLFFGMFPAFKASRIDPIRALHDL